MKTLVETIFDAQQGVYDIPQVSQTYRDFDIPTAYKYQKELVNKYLELGYQIVGYKMGLTSKEKMKQMNVDSPVHGVLFKEMEIMDGIIDYSKLIHPKAEPEIAVKFNKDVNTNATYEELIDSIGYIAPAIDIIDSRYKDFKFTMADVVADNCSSALFVVGEWVNFNKKYDLENIHSSLFINGECKSSGISSAVLGNPLVALYELHQSLSKDNISLKKDEIVLTGAITAASTINSSDEICNKCEEIGSVTIK